MTMQKKPNAKRRHALVSPYNSMVQRCNNPNNKQYADYGGRGIKICERWKENQPNAQGFWNFVADMGNKPVDTTLDRIDNSGDYTPENCRWATRKEQQRNRRNNVFITFNGKTQVARDWANELGINNTTILRRYHLGLPVEIVLSTKSFVGKAF